MRDYNDIRYEPCQSFSLHFPVNQQVPTSRGQVDQKPFEPSQAPAANICTFIPCVSFSPQPTLTSSQCSCWLWKVKTWDAKKKRTLHCNAKKLKSQKCSQKSQQWSIFSRSSRCPSHPLARPSSSVGRPSGLNVSSPGPSFPKYTHVRQPGRALDRLARNLEASLHNPRQPAYIGPRGRHPRWTR